MKVLKELPLVAALPTREVRPGKNPGVVPLCRSLEPGEIANVSGAPDIKNDPQPP